MFFNAIPGAIFTFVLASVVLGVNYHAFAAAPLVVMEQGGRPFGGTQIGDTTKASISCDHGYVEWQIPKTPRKFPILMVHASSTKTWDTTFDGREGFKNIFLRRGYSIYITDLPRTGRAGQACKSTTYQPRLNNDQASFTTWRLGRWLPGMGQPEFYRGVQFAANNKKALDEFLRIQYPEFNDPENENLESDALAVLLKEIGPSVLLTHSSTGIRGWISASKSNNVAAIVSYEPGTAVFPETEMPTEFIRADGSKVAAGNAIPMADFLRLTKIPIQIVWGDYIPKEMKAENTGPLLTLDNRRVNVIKSKLMVEAINRHGGNAQVVMLPEKGIEGNTHFPMMDLNNIEIANLLSKYLKVHQLDKPR